jgi:hypothetical protein
MPSRQSEPEMGLPQFMNTKHEHRSLVGMVTRPRPRRIVEAGLCEHDIGRRADIRSFNSCADSSVPDRVKNVYESTSKLGLHCGPARS